MTAIVRSCGADTHRHDEASVRTSSIDWRTDLDDASQGHMQTACKDTKIQVHLQGSIAFSPTLLQMSYPFVQQSIAL